MKIIYFSYGYYADCDFPLIRTLQRRGHDVRYYIPVTSFFLKSSLLDLKELYPHTGIYPASIYDGFKIYENEIDLSKVFVVNQKYKQKWHPINLLLYIRLVLHFICQKPDVIHLTDHPKMMMRLLYLIKDKLVLTVHDPFMHSSSYDKRSEAIRIEAHKKINKLILLNRAQVDGFRAKYNVPLRKIFLSKLGSYDTITRINSIPSSVQTPYILFFGGINKYKGLEFLFEAMVQVHKKHPYLKLVVAGGGRLWFDISKYKNLDYFDLRLHYVGVPELGGLLESCEFCVCPYRDATQSGVVQTALSMLCPLIVTNVGALPEVVIDGKYGKVIEPENIESLAAAIIELHENPEMLSMMRTNIKNEWIPDMSWENIADQYINCYNA